MCLSPVGRLHCISIITHVESYLKASASATYLSLPTHPRIYVFDSFTLGSLPISSPSLQLRSSNPFSTLLELPSINSHSHFINTTSMGRGGYN